MYAGTDVTAMRTDKWWHQQGTDLVRLVDTPGLDDPKGNHQCLAIFAILSLASDQTLHDAGRDASIIADIVDRLRALVTLNVILLVFNGQAPR